MFDPKVFEEIKINTQTKIDNGELSPEGIREAEQIIKICNKVLDNIIDNPELLK